MKKPQKLKITYRYIKPKTKEEKAEAQMRLDRVFDRLFEEVLKRRRKPVDDSRTSG